MTNTLSQPVVLLFSGQGNPVIGMGSDLWDINETTKSIWDCASDIAGVDLRRLCLKGPMNRLIQTTVQQIAVTAINVTLYSLWRERFADAQVVGSCGHSVGEYSALYASGALTLETVFELIRFRANLMHQQSEKNKGTMLALKGVDYDTLRNIICRSGIELDISCDNTPRQQVVGGQVSALNDFARVLLAEGHEAIKLGVSGAWHTRLMAEGVQPMRDYLAGIAILPPQHDVLMNVTAKPEAEPAMIKENLSLHLTHTVKWRDSLSHFLQRAQPVRFVEISNKPYLGQMLQDFAGFDVGQVIHCRKAIAM
ncbi:ACP S-malonyltransferase [Kosakonia radicincitans]|uniref:ACP S-malonyltransferase n=1 Tax=Kosakonia TaxID=1330547 RepID=UPI0008AB2ACB|nr:MULTISPECIES: ACP S-malonyltransferase [Kosakonia]PTA90260.1 ACP S-malonyltransferase [Kosakonia sp. H7A]QEM93374.1 ACP S-malonyltransferase [Kosakonia radicincitans]SET46188.1 [acyl-carrier-protein] S-malonyltransferase [Kosakonia radicincitans]